MFHKGINLRYSFADKSLTLQSGWFLDVMCLSVTIFYYDIHIRQNFYRDNIRSMSSRLGHCNKLITGKKKNNFLTVQ